MALSGIFPLSGFFSKDEILLALDSASHAAHEEGGGWPYALIYWLAILTAFMTAFYTGRAFFMTFFGPEKLPSPTDPEAPPGQARRCARRTRRAHDRPRHHGEGVTGLPHEHHGEIGHESPPVMTFPLLALAGCTVLIGLICLVAGPFLGGATEWFAHHLHKTLAFESLGHEEHAFSWATAIVGTLVGVLGIGLSYVMYAQTSTLPGRLGGPAPSIV